MITNRDYIRPIKALQKEGVKMVVSKISKEKPEYKIGYVDGYNKAMKEMKIKETAYITHCKDCKWWSKNKLKCYRPFAHRQANGNSFCDKGVKNEQPIHREK